MDAGGEGGGCDGDAPARTAYTLQGVMRSLQLTIDRAEAEQGPGDPSVSPPALDVRIPTAETPPDVDDP
jgi:hypothetical protein